MPLVAASVGIAVGVVGASTLESNAPAIATAVLAVSIVWFAHVLVSRAVRPVRPALAVAGLVVSASALGSALLAEEPAAFTISLAAAPIAAALVASLTATPLARRVTVILLSGVLGLFGLLSLWLLVSGADSTVGVVIEGEVVRRLYPASFGHPNQYAAALVLLIPFPVAAALADGPRRARIGFALCAVLGTAAILLTYSRAFWIATVIAAIVAAGTRRARIVVVAAGAVLALAAGPRIIDRLLSADTFDNVRFDIWGQALHVIASHPFLGVGLENFPNHSGTVVLPDSLHAPPHAHNMLLSAASEIGIIGALALFAGIVTLLLRLASRPPASPGDRVPALACAGALTAVLVGGLLDAVIFHNAQTVLVASVVVGLSAAVTYPHMRGTP